MMYFIRPSRPADALILAAEEVGKGFEHLYGGTDCSVTSNPDVTADLSITTDPSLPGRNDRYVISIENGRGSITGSDDFSALAGAYRVLFELGWRWPSPVSTVVPESTGGSITGLSMEISSEASYRHRGIVIEGGNRLENAIRIVEWMPKVGMNSFFLQFKIPYVFFAAWYTHQQNDSFEPEPFNRLRATRMGHAVEEALSARGMHIHAVGHAWTCDAVGLDGLSWDSVDDSEIEPIRDRLALVDGKRGLHGGVPINTNLCYSDERNIEAMTEKIVEYAREHSNLDVLHIWLADDHNNICECEECQKTTPADQYIRLLNRVDARLTEEGLPTRLCMLLYNDLLAAPEKERIVNEDRFILMFAPIARTFEKGFADTEEIPVAPKYVRNRNGYPTRVEDNLSYLRAWQETFHGEAFDFDYHLGRAHYGDPGYEKISRLISSDIKELEGLGLDGLMSCQELRCSFPTNLPNYTMAKTLWDRDADFDGIRKEYYTAEYGNDGMELSEVLEKVSDTFNMDYWNHKYEYRQEWMVKSLERVPELSEELSTLAEKALAEKGLSRDQRKRWNSILILSHYIVLFGRTISKKAEGASSREEYLVFRDFVKKHELETEEILDTYRLLRLCGEYLRLGD